MASVRNIDAVRKKLLLDILEIESVEYNNTIGTVNIGDSMMHMELMVTQDGRIGINIKNGENT